MSFTYHILPTFPDEPTDEEKIKRIAFFEILHSSDQTDWPIEYDYRDNIMEPKDASLLCQKCGGFIYKSPRVGLAHLLNLAKVLNLNLKIIRFFNGETCANRKKTA